MMKEHEPALVSHLSRCPWLAQRWRPVVQVSLRHLVVSRGLDDVVDVFGPPLKHPFKVGWVASSAAIGGVHGRLQRRLRLGSPHRFRQKRVPDGVAVFFVCDDGSEWWWWWW